MLKKKTKRKTAFTLVEILIVVIVMAVLSSLVVPKFRKTVETSKDEEAFTTLRLIRAGEAMYKSLFGFFYPVNGSGTGIATSNLNDINTNLRLDLEQRPDWDFSITRVGMANDFRATADRGKDRSSMNLPRYYYIRKDGQITQTP